ncbi:hypothetical protein CspeluHIS016_0406000 [Cutaneotrichosporon spelunceum]|uniref:CRIB domain-containing protein n=1 Tax=Cutaneotrichosporon spelunceum TaxID=1672016 RepID=A0AAD3TWB2_9TREE|nr:hypothetical protein CspeluHIS016_0406000 [Cutaneotrichosporon spelunceum]
MPASHSPARSHTKTFLQTTLERTSNETPLRERRGLDALASPCPPFSHSYSTQTTPRNAHHDLHTSTSSASLRLPQSPAPSLTPSMTSVTPSQAPSFAPSFTPSFTPSTDSLRGLFRRTHRASTSISPPTSISISPTQWQPTMPSAILSRQEPTRPTASRSVSDSVMPTLQPKPKLQRKKSNASLLYKGLGRGLSRVGSVMRRGGNSNNIVPPPDPQSSSSSSATSSVASSNTTDTKSRRQPSRCGSTTLQDLCEEAENAVVEKDPDARLRQAPIKRSVVLSTHLPPPSPEKVTGVSRPFNVQHSLHVTPELDGLPSKWLESLKAQGVTERDLLLITNAQSRQRAVPNHPIVRTITPIDTSRPPSPNSSRAPSAAPSPSPAKTESTILKTPSKDATPPNKGSHSARASSSTRLGSPVPAIPTTGSPSQLTVPGQQTRGRVQGRSSTITSPSASSRRNLKRTPQERGVAVKRSASLLGKLLDEIDSKSSRPSNHAGDARAEPLIPLDPDSEDEEELVRRLSEDLRGFHGITIPGEDGWAASILAAWDKDNTLVQEVKGLGPSVLGRRLTQDGPHRPRSVEHPDTIASPSLPSRSPTPNASAYVGGLSKPRSASSLAIPSVDVDDVDDSSSGFYVRRRSHSFDQHIVDRSTLYSPPPPPPHPQRHIPDTGGTPPTSFRSPHGGRLRASRDSFGVAHTISSRSSFIAASSASQGSRESRHRRDSNDSLDGRVQTDDSHTTSDPSPSRSSSELNLGTPPTSGLSTGRKASSAGQSDTKNRSLIHERLSVASAIEAPRCRPVSMPLGSADPPLPISVDHHETRHLSLPLDHHGLVPQAPSSVESLNSTMAQPYSPTEEDFYDQYLGVGWCSACSFSQTPGIGNMPAASTSVLGLSLNTPLEHTCTLGLSRHASVRSQASSYGADRASVLSVGGTSQLSRMSSIASSTHSYNLHEVTVHRAYTRVLRRVPERSETQQSSESPSEVGESGESEANMSISVISADNWYSARQSMQSGSSAIAALEEAAWRVAVREGGI